MTYGVQGQCELSQAIGYQFYATIGAFYLPLVVMIVIYGRIFAVSKRIADAEARTMAVSVGVGDISSRSGSTAVFDAASLSGGAGPKHRTDTNRCVVVDSTACSINDLLIT